MYKKQIFMLVLFFALLTGVLAVDRYSSSKSVQLDTDSDVATLASFEADILASEYQVREVETAVYQAPNRVNGWRTFFNKEGVQIVPRTDTQDNWSLELTLTHVGDEASLVVVDDATLAAHGNQINYKRGDVVEWYINNNRGLEQGFTFETHPTDPGAEMLHLDLAVGGTLVGHANQSHAIEFLSPDGEIILNYDQLYAFDADAKPLPARMTLQTDDNGAQTVRLSVETADAAFPVVIDPLASSADWQVYSDQDDLLGYSVSTAGDVNNDGYDDVIIGANWYDAGATDTGAAFVFLGSADGLGTMLAWEETGAAANDEFGYSVSEAGDVNNDGFGDVIIGAIGADSAYIYYGSDDGLDSSTEQVLSQQAGSEFGRSVSGAGDVNNDGNDDVIVGAPAYQEDGTVFGRAFVYYGSDLGVGSDADWAAQSGFGNRLFGFSVSNAGDVNGDLIDDVVIGDPQDDGEISGEVYIYLGAETIGLPDGPVTSSFDADWVGSDPRGGGSNSQYGSAVSTVGDVNNDDIDDIIVGSPFAAVSVDVTGEAYVYIGPLDGLAQAPRVDLFGFVDGEKFGYSVGTAGDVDNDGDDDPIVGSPGFIVPIPQRAGGGGDGEGRFTIFQGISGGIPSFLQPLATVDGDEDGSEFGFSVDTAGDVNGDGFADAIVGAPSYVGSSLGSGRAFLFNGTGPVVGLTAVNDGPTELGDETTLFATTTSPQSGLNEYLWDFGDGTLGSGVITTHTYETTGLYTVVLTASNPLNGSSLVATTLVSVVEEVLVDPANGGTGTFNDGNGNQTEINVPAGAVNVPITIEYTPLDIDSIGSRGVSFAGIEQPLPDNPTDFFFDLEAGLPNQQFLPILFSNTSSSRGLFTHTNSVAGTCDPDHFCFNEPVTLNLTYDEDNLNGVAEGDLTLVVWDENIMEWVDATTTCGSETPQNPDTDNNVLTLEICHISRFGVVGIRN